MDLEIDIHDKIKQKKNLIMFPILDWSSMISINFNDLEIERPLGNTDGANGLLLLAHLLPDGHQVVVKSPKRRDESMRHENIINERLVVNYF